MKKVMMLGTVMAMLLGLAIAASAGNVERMKANIPFDFYVDKQLLPAGEYVFEMRPITPSAATASSVSILKLDRTLAAILHTMPGSDPQYGDHLHFSRYGSKYFLAKVESVGFQASMRKSSLEKEVGSQFKSAGTKVALNR